MKLFSAVLLSVLLTAGSYSQETDRIPKKKVKVSWTKIKNSVGYILEIQDSKGEIIFKADAGDKTFLEPVMAEGSYRKRLIVKNILGEEIQGGWTPLLVKAPRKNEIVYDSPKVREAPEEIKPVSKWDVIVRSALVPGLGQIYSGKNITQEKKEVYRGYAYSGFFATAVLAELALLDHYAKSKSETAKDTQIRLAFSSGVPDNSALRNPAVFFNYMHTNTQYNDLANKKQTLETGIGILGFIYLAQLADAVYLQRKISLLRSESQSFQFHYRKVQAGFSGMEDNYSAEFRFAFQ